MVYIFGIAVGTRANAVCQQCLHLEEIIMKPILTTLFALSLLAGVVAAKPVKPAIDNDGDAIGPTAMMSYDNPR